MNVNTADHQKPFDNFYLLAAYTSANIQHSENY